MRTKLMLLFLAACAAALAQQSSGYIYVAPGAETFRGYSSATLHIGGGGEIAIAKGIAAGAEIGVLGATQNYSNSALGVFSPGLSYHFIHNPRSRLDPFVAGGYSLMFRSGHGSLGNFGGGLNYWFHRHVALRVEVRDHLRSEYGGTLHFWGVRMGFSFR